MATVLNRNPGTSTCAVPPAKVDVIPAFRAGLPSFVPLRHRTSVQVAVRRDLGLGPESRAVDSEVQPNSVQRANSVPARRKHIT